MDLAIDVGTVMAGALGLLLGYAIRLSEVLRTERKISYLSYLRALDRLPHAFMEAAVLESAEVPTQLAEEAAESIAEAEADMSLTASHRVLQSVAKLRAVVSGPELIQLVHSTLAGTAGMTSEERERRQLVFLERYWRLVQTSRTAVVNDMRRDLRVRKLRPGDATTSTWA